MYGPVEVYYIGFEEKKKKKKKGMVSCLPNRVPLLRVIFLSAFLPSDPLVLFYLYKRHTDHILLTYLLT
jgi:hypothetical protein